MAWQTDALLAFQDRYRVDQSSGCWVWIGNTIIRGGYGAFTHRFSGRQMQRAHRASWELHLGAIPAGMDVLHKCDNRLCVNPDHLFLGDQAENMKDKVAKSRQNWGETHGRRKLTAAEVSSIRSSVETAKVIAARFQISETTVYDIRKRRSWFHLS